MSEKKPYDKIYLIGWYAEYPRPSDFGDEVTWCQNPIGENEDCPDIEYIRKDLVDEQLTKAKERIAELEGIIDLYEQQFFPNGFDEGNELHIHVATASEGEA